VTRSPSSILFGLIFCLALALVVWWTIFLANASQELESAGLELAAGNVQGAAAAFGAQSAEDMVDIGRTRFWMFTSEGIVFAIVLTISGLLYLASTHRESKLRATQDRFLAGATHELKTPLATMSLLLESLRDDRLPSDKRAHYIQMGLLEANRLERGITNVLVAAGLRTAARRDCKARGDLVVDIQQAIAELEPRAAAADVRVTADTPDSVLALRDPESLQMILRNLLDNAIKFSPSGGTVLIELTADDEQACFTVSDTGRGLDEQELSNAFQPFWRGSDGSQGGSGLGLHLVRELTRSHGGEVTAKSTGRDSGATFTVRLPRHESAQ